MPATGIRRRLPPQAEGSGLLDRAGVARGRNAEDVTAGATAPRDGCVALRETATGERPEDHTAGRLDAKRDAGRSRQLEARRDATMARPGGEEAEGRVQGEISLCDLLAAEFVVRDDAERPVAFALAAPVPVEPVRAGLLRPRIERHDDAAGPV